MSNYVGKSPISTYEGILYLAKIKAFEKPLSRKLVTQYTYEQAFAKLVHSLERQAKIQFEFTDWVTLNVQYEDFYAYTSEYAPYPKSPDGLKFTEVHADIVAYFEECGYNVQLVPAYIYRGKADGSIEFKEWDDEWGWPDANYANYDKIPEGWKVESAPFRMSLSIK